MELWGNVWSFLGPFFAAVSFILFLYILFPEKLEKIVVHVFWVFSYFSGWVERKAITHEVAHMVSTNFAKTYGLEEVPRIVVKWGEEDEAILDLKKNLLLVVLRRGKKHRYENIARAILKAIPELLTPEMKVVYNPMLIDCLSAHIARSLVEDSQPIVTAINEFVASELEKDEEIRKFVSMIVEIDDESFLSRILLPELIKVAKLRYPHRDPQIDDEVLNLVKTLHDIVKGDVSKPMICGKYFGILFVRVARPEKLAAVPDAHLRFVEHSLSECPAIETIYILAAGEVNITAAKMLRTICAKELTNTRVKLEVSDEQEYKGMYRKKRYTKLYVCKMKVERK